MNGLVLDSLTLAGRGGGGVLFQDVRVGVAVLMMASMHEVEALRVMLESMLIQVQMPAELRTSH